MYILTCRGFGFRVGIFITILTLIGTFVTYHLDGSSKIISPNTDAFMNIVNCSETKDTKKCISENSKRLFEEWKTSKSRYFQSYVKKGISCVILTFRCVEASKGGDTKLLLDLQRCFYDTKVVYLSKLRIQLLISGLVIYGVCFLQLIVGALSVFIVCFTSSKFCTQQEQILQIKEEIKKFTKTEELQEAFDEFAQESKLRSEHQSANINKIQKKVGYHENKIELLNQITNELTLDYCALNKRGFMIVSGDGSPLSSSHEMPREPVKIRIRDKNLRKYSFNISNENGRNDWQNFVNNIKKSQPPYVTTKRLRYCDIQRYDSDQAAFKRIFVPGRGWMSRHKFEEEENMYGLTAIIKHVKEDNE